jgi:restriction endonuclease Mrr
LTPETHDAGVDLYVVQHTVYGRLLTVVDCKRRDRDRPVGVSLVRELLGTVQTKDASAGVIATTSRFSGPATQLAERYPFRLALQDYFDLQSMLRDATRK